jgi:hypothetical protein
MSDLGDMVRLFDSLGIEHEVSSAWSGTSNIKIVDVPDPDGPVDGTIYGTEYRFDPTTNTFIGMTMYYQHVDPEETDDQV